MAVPFLTSEIQKEMKWKDGDIVVSVPFKSGTTWTMNICYQLREGGDPDLEDLYKEVPWTEFLINPEKTVEGICKELDERPEERRIFKTHSTPSEELRYFEPSDDLNIKYVVVFRNPEEATGSAYPFLAAHNPDFMELWGMPRDSFNKWKYFEDFYYEFFRPAGFYMGFYGGLKNWWPYRHNSNVLFLHFSDMKKDHEGSLRKISDFLGFEPTEEQWPNILEYTSFPWMRKNSVKFELPTFFDFKFLKKGGMIRRGTSEMQACDGITEEISEDLASLGKEVLTDEEAFKWLYYGGPLP